MSPQNALRCRIRNLQQDPADKCAAQERSLRGTQSFNTHNGIRGGFGRLTTTVFDLVCVTVVL